jgi:murein DD-endopeptidase MepM/ murein hydrolase activator NlpD
LDLPATTTFNHWTQTDEAPQLRLPAPAGAWELTTRLKIINPTPFVLNKDFYHTGLMVYFSQYNIFYWGKLGPVGEVALEKSGSSNVLLKFFPSLEVELMIAKDGTTYSFSYRAPGSETWTLVGCKTTTESPQFVGLIAKTTQPTNLMVDVDYLRLSDRQPSQAGFDCPATTAPSGIQVIGIYPSPQPLYERTLLKDTLSFALDFRNVSGQPLFFQRGEVSYFDEQGRPMGQATFDAQAFSANSILSSSTVVLNQARVFLMFPFTEFPRKRSPGEIEVRLFFSGLSAPVVFSKIRPRPYEQNHRAYRFLYDRPRQGEWFVGNHRRKPPASLGFLGDGVVASQHYAYDFLVMVNGGTSQGSPSFNNSFFAFDEPILAVADGVVVQTRDGVAENIPIPGGGSSNVVQGNGNFIVLDHGEGEYSFYAHIKQGSVRVQVGQAVKQGEMLGLVGNSGATSEPHTHFDLRDSPYFFVSNPRSPSDSSRADGVPIYFTNVSFGGFRQLRTALPVGTLITAVEPPVTVAAPVRTYGPGAVAEVEPNNNVTTAQAIALPATVSGSVELADRGVIADGGDGIEDIYRIDVTEAGTLTLELSFNAGADVDMVLVNTELYVLNPPRAGTTLSNPERLEIKVQPGAYFLFISIFDPGPTQPVTPYTLQATFSKLR